MLSNKTVEIGGRAHDNFSLEEYLARSPALYLRVGIRSKASVTLRRAARARDSVADAEHAPRSQRLRLYLVLATLTILGPFAIDMYLPGLPVLARDLHAGESASQL